MEVNFISILYFKQNSLNFLLMNCFPLFVINAAGIPNRLKMLFLQKQIFISEVIFRVFLASIHFMKWLILMITYLLWYSAFENRKKISMSH